MEEAPVFGARFKAVFGLGAALAPLTVSPRNDREAVEFE